MKFRTQATEIVSALPDSLSCGLRVLFLIQREKDGGSTKEEKRIFSNAVIADKEELIQKMTQFLAIKDAYADEVDLRIYLSVNSRNQYVATRNVLDSIIESFYCPDIQKDLIIKKLLRGAKSSLMNPNARQTKFFLIDVDLMPDVDTYQEALTCLAERNVTIIHEQKTRNGWHIITEPFNPSEWSPYSEIKKDALMLLL